jgi:hypothetical protein
VLLSAPNHEKRHRKWTGNFRDGVLDGEVAYSDFDGSEKKGVWYRGKKVRWLTEEF